VLSSPWIGDVEWDPECELLFPCGLPGFEEERHMIPVEIPAQRPLVYLQSLQQRETCFVCLPILTIDKDFRLVLSEDERATILLTGDGAPVIGVDVLCLGLLMPRGSTIVINLHNYRGVQCLSQDLKAPFQLEENGEWAALC
jgi:flagellar assembly factor FliW